MHFFLNLRVINSGTLKSWILLIDDGEKNCKNKIHFKMSNQIFIDKRNTIKLN